MRFETKCEKLGITDEVKAIMEHCELYEGNDARIVEISKLRVWEVQEMIGNYLDAEKYGNEFCLESKTMKTFCKSFGIIRELISYYYARAISEQGEEIGYAITEDIVLVLN